MGTASTRTGHRLPTATRQRTAAASRSAGADPERGAISAFVAVVAVALIAIAGLVLDGGRLLAARREAQDIAGNAARAGAQALDEEQLREGRTVVDPAAAAAAVAHYLDRTPATGNSTTAGDVVTVQVRMPVRLLVLTAGGGRRTVTATERARAVRGVTTGDG